MLSEHFQMNKAKQYHTKLLEIKKEMAALHEKSAKIKVSKISFFILHFLTLH